ncbi:hypothetical protein [Kitasatospora griseola]|uniref:hypothetical protein n=1 Tax=Kitasatospora griseola TaxID=2064 RepID=UPI00364DED2A
MVTWQESGWNLVLKVLLLDLVSDSDLRDDVVLRWSTQWAAGEGGIGKEIRWVHSLGGEVEQHVAGVCDGTAGRSLHATVLGPADLLARARGTGERRWWGLWQEYVDAATPANRGHRSPVGFSRSLTALLPGLAQVSDADLATEQLRAVLPPLGGPAWSRLRADAALQLQVLDAAGRGPNHLAWLLQDLGLPTESSARVRLAA